MQNKYCWQSKKSIDIETYAPIQKQNLSTFKKMMGQM